MGLFPTFEAAGAGGHVTARPSDDLEAERLDWRAVCRGHLVSTPAGGRLWSRRGLAIRPCSTFDTRTLTNRLALEARERAPDTNDYP
jgi:hypothetical protein